MDEVKGSRKKGEIKFLKYFVGVLIFAILFITLNYFLFFHQTTINYEWGVPRTKTQRSSRWEDVEGEHANKHNKYYNHDDMKFMIDVWPSMVQAVESLSVPFIERAMEGDWFHQELNSTIQSSKIFQLYWNDCWNDRKNSDPDDGSFLRLSKDLTCNFLWMLNLRQEPIVKIDRLADVVPKTKEIAHLRKQSGGMRCTLENQLMAYWKPCTIKTGNGETYISEIISFHIDRLLQFNRAPVVVPRFITNPDILHLAGELQNSDASSVQKIESALKYCGGEDGIEGAFVGWSPLVVELVPLGLRKEETPRLSELTKEEVKELAAGRMNITRDSDKKAIEWALENITAHMFGVLIGSLTRFRHNQHFLKMSAFTKGPMIYIDNDRAQWRHYAHDIDDGLPLNEFCIFPKALAERVLMLSATHIRLGDILIRISEIYRPYFREFPLFTPAMAHQLQKNIHWLADCIQTCINTKGEEAVLIPEYWKSDTVNPFDFPSASTFYEMLLSFEK